MPSAAAWGRGRAAAWGGGWAGGGGVGGRRRGGCRRRRRERGAGRRRVGECGQGCRRWEEVEILRQHPAGELSIVHRTHLPPQTLPGQQLDFRSVRKLAHNAGREVRLFV